MRTRPFGGATYKYWLHVCVLRIVSRLAWRSRKRGNWPNASVLTQRRHPIAPQAAKSQAAPSTSALVRNPHLTKMEHALGATPHGFRRARHRHLPKIQYRHKICIAHPFTSHPLRCPPTCCPPSARVPASQKPNDQQQQQQREFHRPAPGGAQGDGCHAAGGHVGGLWWQPRGRHQCAPCGFQPCGR